MKSIRIFLLKSLCTEVHARGWIPGNVSRKKGCLQNIICHAATQVTVTLWRGLQGLQWNFKIAIAERTGQGFFSHFHEFWCLSIWRILSLMFSQIHQGRWCCSDLRVEEVSGSFMSTGVAAKLIKMIKKDDFFCMSCKWALQWHLITWRYTPAFNFSRVRKSEVLEMTLNHKKELL